MDQLHPEEVIGEVVQELKQTLLDYKKAVEALSQCIKKTPRVPQVRAPQFTIRLREGAVWLETLFKAKVGVVAFTEGGNLMRRGNSTELLFSSDAESAAEVILKVARTPREILEVIKLLDRAKAWCYARIQGLERAREHLIKAQSWVLEEIKTRQAMRKL